jgi:uncharacterized protein
MPRRSSPNALPQLAIAGAGARFQHLAALEQSPHLPPLLEFHTENLFALPTGVCARIQALRERAEFSLHCVGLSLGSADGIDSAHLKKVQALVERYQPVLVSDHACWNAFGGAAVPDLLPLPHTDEVLDIMAANVAKMQDVLGLRVLIENLSFYLRFDAAQMEEPQFLRELCARTGCGLLLDINNLEINRRNFGVDPEAYLHALRAEDVVEYHLAGGEQVATGWVDTHSRPVDDPTWALYDTALRVIGPRHTIVEWDQDLPPLHELLREVSRAAHMLHSPVRLGLAS